MRDIKCITWVFFLTGTLASIARADFPQILLADGRAGPTLVTVTRNEPVFPLNNGQIEGNTIPPHERAVLSADVDELVAGNNQFALDLYRRLADQQNTSENLLASPLSISTALGMTYAGARGRTAQQMSDVLRFRLPDEKLHNAFGELLHDLDASREGYQLSIANRLFFQEGFPLRRSFLDVTSQQYGAPVEQLNFVGDPDGSRERINTWVEEKTNDKIQDLLPPGSVTTDTRLVLTNAIYFNGQWKYKFDEDATHDAPFYAANGEVSQAATMFQQQKFRYGEFDGFQMLEMPYAGDDLSMVVMLPNTGENLASFEASLTGELLDSSLAALSEREVQVYLPKFKFEASFGLAGTLQDMGMTDAFGAADFSGIGDGNLAISDVLHKAFIDVNEAGTEAAAATAVTVVLTSLVLNPPPPPVFRADHPFLFALRDTHSESLMFLGRMAQPGESVISELAAANVPEPSALLLTVTSGLLSLFTRRRLCTISFLQSK